MIYYHSVTVRHSKSPVHHGQGIFELYPNAEVGMARSPKAVRIADGIFYWFAMSVKSYTASILSLELFRNTL